MLSLAKPEYVLRPKQMLRRIRNQFWPVRGAAVTARLPWGWPIEVRPQEVIGRCILNIGVYDLAVSELLWRLIDPGETVVDAGANIGYMTSILARRVGPGGRVFSFEAHPEIARELRQNVDRWKMFPAAASIKVINSALSDHEGQVQFELPDDFATNRGTGRVSSNRDTRSGAKAFMVDCGTLDTFLKQTESVGVVKMDVEGHEEAVLKGASGLLKEHKVRDWIFEHHETYPSPITNILEQSGYTLFQVQKRFLRLDLTPMSQPVKRSDWEPQSYLATMDPARAKARVRSAGWRSLANSGT